ncbi:helix-turn-helix domain-containing protein [methane-oxidizing endosymbiont of Gigantopelta aegis]|uniref:helix-turn-helix domain-containing protein n=1 Tax=methane-oxidizing endosymbiont of Gigantopelta aegis TaxID=2794938 RepID=UPI0018DD484A|nr:helix-turn-helix domain-containing protein [methane-oxidizing endosymbiont of Gigantopelta aegis]
MPIRVTIELSEEELQILETIIKKGSDWRERDRAMTIKLLHEGMSTADIAKQQGHHVESIRRRRRRWLKEGFASLPESPRSGAPQKISLEAQQLLSQWVTEEALTSRYLLKKLKDECGIEVSDRCLHQTLKRLGFVWKRTRYSLKKA